MPPAGFEPAIPASEQQHTYTLDRAATEIGTIISYYPPINAYTVQTLCFLQDIGPQLYVSFLCVLHALRIENPP